MPLQYKLVIRMEEALDHNPPSPPPPYSPDPALLSCPLCQRAFQRPTTLACGHSFCQGCLMGWIEEKLGRERVNSAVGRIPLCPRCHSIIWRPLASLKENVTLSALVRRFCPPDAPLDAPKVPPTLTEAQFHILILPASTSNTLLPHCFSQVVFATAFIDEIIEQQAQHNLVVIKGKEGKEGEGLAIAGRLIRPETYHYMMRAGRYETVYKATFEGKYFVRVKEWQQLQLKVNSSSYSQRERESTSPIMLCQVQQITAQHPLTLDQFAPFFEVYDKLNNPIYLRQIAQLVDEKVLHDRSSPQKLVYCVMRLLRLKESEVQDLARMMDDQQRWMEIQDFLVKNATRSPTEIVKIDIPGNYPHALVFAILLILIIFHYMAK